KPGGDGAASAGGLRGAAGSRHIDRPGPHVRGQGGGAGVEQHCPEVVRGDLRGVVGRGRRAGEGGAEEAQPGATGPDDRHRPRGGEAGNGSDRLGRGPEPVADRAVERGEAGEAEGDFDRGGAHLSWWAFPKVLWDLWVLYDLQGGTTTPL